MALPAAVLALIKGALASEAAERAGAPKPVQNILSAGVGGVPSVLKMAVREAAKEAANRKKPSAKDDVSNAVDADTDTFNPESDVAAYKKGGKVKAYAKGGSVRGDGCAQRGKTKGRMV